MERETEAHRRERLAGKGRKRRLSRRGLFPIQWAGRLDEPPRDMPSNAQVKAGDRGSAFEAAPPRLVPNPELIHRQRHQQQDKESIAIFAEPSSHAIGLLGTSACVT